MSNITDIEKLNFYSWTNDGMDENPNGIPSEDVFILRSDVLKVLQNKVRDISAEEVLDKYYEPKMHWKTVNRWNVLKAMEEYAISEIYDALDEYKAINASIVNERKGNIPADFKQVTGHDSPKEMMAYEKGREDEQEVIMKWIEKWDGSGSSVMGSVLKKKFIERKDSAGSESIEFADWMSSEGYQLYDGAGVWIAPQNNNNVYSTKELYQQYLQSLK